MSKLEQINDNQNIEELTSNESVLNESTKTTLTSKSTTTITNKTQNMNELSEK